MVMFILRRLVNRGVVWSFTSKRLDIRIFERLHLRSLFLCLQVYKSIYPVAENDRDPSDLGY